ncbi:MAG: hypothetical protein WKF65_10410 [Gaiellaceae bacterium]
MTGDPACARGAAQRRLPLCWGKAGRAAGGGYVRLFPTIGGLPGIPGRYYPAEPVLCWSWRQPDRDCWRASSNAVQLLAPLASLPRWQQPPSVLAELRYRGLRVRPALANLHVALELAFDRDGTAAASVPAGALRFTGRWRGPAAACTRSTAARGRNRVLREPASRKRRIPRRSRSDGDP